VLHLKYTLNNFFISFSEIIINNLILFLFYFSIKNLYLNLLIHRIFLITNFTFLKNNIVIIHLHFLFIANAIKDMFGPYIMSCLCYD
jgi:hypothetical protein